MTELRRIMANQPAAASDAKPEESKPAEAS